MIIRRNGASTSRQPRQPQSSRFATTASRTPADKSVGVRRFVGELSDPEIRLYWFAREKRHHMYLAFRDRLLLSTVDGSIRIVPER
jgi:hypothetical protein